MAARLITVFGGAGFVGKALMSHLVRDGVRIRVAARNPNASMTVLPQGDVSQIQLVQANLKNEASIRAAIQGADVVINLAGCNYNDGKDQFSVVHDLGAEMIAKVCTEYGVKKLIHLSDLISDISESACDYAQSKAAGEEKVRAAFPEATILRPSVIFGQGDDLFNAIARVVKVYPVTPLFNGSTKLQPIFVGDVAEAIKCAALSDKYKGKTYDLGGSEILTVQELYEKTMEETSQETVLFPVPDFVAPMKAWGLNFLPNAPMNLGKYKAFKMDSLVGKKAKTLKDFDIAPTKIDSVLPIYMETYCPKGQFQRFI
jgi:NADH dehydrogenase